MKLAEVAVGEFLEAFGQCRVVLGFKQAEERQEPDMTLLSPKKAGVAIKCL